MREHKNEIAVYFSIQGEDFDPKELTQKLCIEPTETYRKGDIIQLYKNLVTRPGDAPPRYRKTAWQYNLGYHHTLDSDDISDILEEKFVDKVDLIKDYVTKHALIVRLNVVLKIDPEQTPAVGFKGSFIKLLSALDAEIDMDIYVIALDDWEKEALY